MLRPRVLPLVPEITLYLLADDYPKESLGRESYEKLMANPPYWAFCWGGGQAMARFILDNPDSVKSTPVVDFGAGSGVAAIAALLAGAPAALAVDIDPVALAAATANGRLNGVLMKPVQEAGRAPDRLVLAADICYEESGMAGVQQHLGSGGRVLVSDSRIEQLTARLPGLRQVAEYSVKTFPDLDEHQRYDSVGLYSNFL
ncbi:MAG: 50S ribosomal protein L11 methyltransferase [Ketobacteraceae bacterium]|nr:50S ribosomal protein L11 methyltransferase [Ketobacteraceae bacterium]